MQRRTFLASAAAVTLLPFAAEATPEALADAVLVQLRDEANRRTLTDVFTQMHLTLRKNTAECAAQAVARVIEARKPSL